MTRKEYYRKFMKTWKFWLCNIISTIFILLGFSCFSLFDSVLLQFLLFLLFMLSSYIFGSRLLFYWYEKFLNKYGFSLETKDGYFIKGDDE